MITFPPIFAHSECVAEFLSTATHVDHLSPDSRSQRVRRPVFLSTVTNVDPLSSDSRSQFVRRPVF